MDPISQFTIGACAALALQTYLPHHPTSEPQVSTSDPQLMRARRRWAALTGGLAGAAPDLDVFIRSSQDPLLSLEFHRHFTHAFAFIPVGGTLVALALWLLFKKRILRVDLSLRHLLVLAICGWATHGLLDACTSYGTQLLWPVSSVRVAWNLIGIIDPFPTLAWLGASLFAVLSLRESCVRWVRLSLIWSLVYLLTSAFQLHRAESLQAQLIQSRHGAVSVQERAVAGALRTSVKPTLFQNLLWKSVYEWQGKIYTDALWMGSDPKIYAGQCIEKYQVSGSKASVLEDDLRRFAWFSDDWLGVVEDRSTSSGQISVGDVRYSMLPHQIAPLWGIEFSPSEPDRHVQTWSSRRGDGGTLSEYFKMMRGESVLADGTQARSVSEVPRAGSEMDCGNENAN